MIKPFLVGSYTNIIMLVSIAEYKTDVVDQILCCIKTTISSVDPTNILLLAYKFTTELKADEMGWKNALSIYMSHLYTDSLKSLLKVGNQIFFF